VATPATHEVPTDADRGKLAIALGLIVGAVVHSLALFSHAAHMLPTSARPDSRS